MYVQTKTITMDLKFHDKKDRYVMYPIKYPVAFDFYKKHVAKFWTVEEIDLCTDIIDFKTKLTDDERYFIQLILAFFAGSDGIVLENLALRFYHDIPIAEVRAFYAVQMFMETIHSETYSLLIDTLVPQNQKEQLFNAVQEIPCVATKAQWCLKWIEDKQASFALRLVAFIITEGIFFSSSFCAIFYFKKRNLLQGVSFSNELISSDEALHCDFGIYILHKFVDLTNHVPEINQMFQEAVDIEIEFVKSILPNNLKGMNATLMAQYVKFVANRLLVQMKLEPIFGNISNPFDFMDLISLRGKTNFFNRRVSEYTKAKVLNSTVDKKLDEFSVNEDF